MKAPWLYKHDTIPMMGVDSTGKRSIPLLCDACPCDSLTPKAPVVWFYYSSGEQLVTRGGTAYNQLWRPMPQYDPITHDPIGFQPGHFEGDNWVTGYWVETDLSNYCDCSGGDVTDIAWWADEYQGLNTPINPFDSYTWWLRCVKPTVEDPLDLTNGSQRDITVGMYTYAGLTSGAVKSGIKYYVKDRYGNQIGYRIYTYDNKDVLGAIPSESEGLPEGTVGVLTTNEPCGGDGQPLCESMVAEISEIDNEEYTSNILEDVYDMDDNLLYHTDYGRFYIPHKYTGTCSGGAIIIETTPHTIEPPIKSCVYSFESIYYECCGWSEPRRFETRCRITEDSGINFNTWELDSSGCRAVYYIKGDECNGEIACVSNQPSSIPDKPTIEPSPSCIIGIPCKSEGNIYIPRFYIELHEGCIIKDLSSGTIQNPFNCRANMGFRGGVYDNIRITSRNFNGYLIESCNGPGSFSAGIIVEALEVITYTHVNEHGGACDLSFYYLIEPILE